MGRGSLAGMAALLIAGLAVARPGVAGLNDTGLEVCGKGRFAVGSCSGRRVPAGQDAVYGRDALATAGQLPKVGGGEAGFDFSALDAAGEPVLPGTGAALHACVLDHQTGLLWEVKTRDGGLRDARHAYSWYSDDAASNGGDPGRAMGSGHCLQTGRCDTQAYVADVNAAALCGYSDWRLPTVSELMSLVHYGRRASAIDPLYFPNTAGPHHWTATSAAAQPERAMTVLFDSGKVGANPKSDGNIITVRLVRRQP